MSDSGDAAPEVPAAADVAAQPPAPRVPLGTILREWGRIGCIGFGGPPTHIKLLREPALLPGLHGHRSPYTDPGPGDLPLGRQPEREHGLLVVLSVPVNPPGDLGHPQLDAVVLEQRCHGCVLVPVERPLVLPDHDRIPPPVRIRERGPRARRPAGASATPGCGSPLCRRTRPRSRRAPPSASPPAAAAGPATSQGPASPPPRPARRTRTAGTPGPAPRPGHGAGPPPRTPAWPRRAAARLPGASPLAPRTPRPPPRQAHQEKAPPLSIIQE